MSRYDAYTDPDYDAWADACADEKRKRGATMCQCRHMDMPGTCPGPEHCPMVEREECDE